MAFPARDVHDWFDEDGEEDELPPPNQLALVPPLADEPTPGGPQTADGSCGCGPSGCSEITYISNTTIGISIWATVGVCATAPSASFNAVPLTGAFVAASSGSGYAAASLSSAARTVHDWCNVANAEGTGQCKKCTPLPKSVVIITLSVVLPSVFVIVLTMWWTGFCCCPPPANSCGARRLTCSRAAHRW